MMLTYDRLLPPLPLHPLGHFLGMLNANEPHLLPRLRRSINGLRLRGRLILADREW